MEPIPNSKTAAVDPLVSILPLSGLIMLAMSLSRVLLPLPLGPIMPRDSPCCSLKLTSLSAQNSS